MRGGLGGHTIPAPTPRCPAVCGFVSMHGQAFAKLGCRRHSSIDLEPAAALTSSLMERVMQCSVLLYPGPMLRIYSANGPSLMQLSRPCPSPPKPSRGLKTSEVEKWPASRCSSQYLCVLMWWPGYPRWGEDNSRLGSRVPALVTQQPLVREHVQSVPGEEPPIVMDPPGLVLVRPKKVVEARSCALNAGASRPLVHQAAFGIEVADLFRAGESVPKGVVNQSAEGNGNVTHQARRWRGGLAQCWRLVGVAETYKINRRSGIKIRRLRGFILDFESLSSQPPGTRKRSSRNPYTWSTAPQPNSNISWGKREPLAPDDMADLFPTGNVVGCWLRTDHGR